MWVHSNPLMSYAGVTFSYFATSCNPAPSSQISQFHWLHHLAVSNVRRLEMCLDPYKNWILVDPIFEFLKLLLCCDVALSSPQFSLFAGIFVWCSSLPQFSESDR